MASKNVLPGAGAQEPEHDDYVIGVLDKNVTDSVPQSLQLEVNNFSTKIAHFPYFCSKFRRAS